jgi:uncharacterized protein (TIGR02231 family)
MRLQLLTVLALGLSLTPTLDGQVSLEMQPIESNATITGITLYRNRAAITRTATLDLEAGGHAIFFRDLPSTAYLDSVQAHVSDNASLLSVDTSATPTLVDNSKLVEELVAQIKEVEATLALSNSQSNAIQAQIELLHTLVDKASNDKAPPVNIEEFSAQIAFMGKKMQELAHNKSVNATEIQKQKKQLQNLKQRKQNIASERKNQIDTVIDIGVSSACTVTVQLTYLVTNATWSPSYSIRANVEGNAITIDYDAEIAQKTGENWTDVALTLSTAQPQQSTMPPMPSPWYVTLYEPPPEPSVVGLVRSVSRKNSSEDSSLSFAWQGDKQVLGASAAASIVGVGPAVSFVLPRTLNVPSNAADSQTTSIASIETSAQQYLISVPMLTDRVFTRSEATNKSDYILLPGRASIFHGSDYVGKTSLSTISPNETFPIDLGIDPSITATRTLVEKTTTTTGLFGSGKKTVYEYQIKISNGSNKPISLRVFDRIPISQNEKIEITLDTVSTPLSTDAEYLKTERPQGILRWDLTIPANLTGDQSFSMTWQVTVARGKDVKTTPLPE